MAFAQRYGLLVAARRVRQWDGVETVCLPVAGVSGCTDPAACNFDPSAAQSDAGCVYGCPNANLSERPRRRRRSWGHRHSGRPFRVWDVRRGACRTSRETAWSPPMTSCWCWLCMANLVPIDLGGCILRLRMPQRPTRPKPVIRRWIAEIEAPLHALVRSELQLGQHHRSTKPDQGWGSPGFRRSDQNPVHGHPGGTGNLGTGVQRGTQTGAGGRPKSIRPADDLPFEILYEDDDLFAI